MDLSIAGISNPIQQKGYYLFSSPIARKPFNPLHVLYTDTYQPSLKISKPDIYQSTHIPSTPRYAYPQPRYANVLYHTIYSLVFVLKERKENDGGNRVRLPIRRLRGRTSRELELMGGSCEVGQYLCGKEDGIVEKIPDDITLEK